jgi:AcrR family transcriptional regulator
MTDPSGDQEPTSAKVLLAAAQLFREHGYAASTTRELAARLGIKKASLYYHISSKEDLLHGICLESLRRVHRAVEGAVAAAQDDPRASVEALVRAHLNSMLTDLDMHATMLVELKSLTGQRYEDVRQARDGYEALVAGTVGRAQRAGALRRDVTARHLTLGLLNLLNWTMFWYSPGGDLTPEELAEVLADLYLNGAGSA